MCIQKKILDLRERFEAEKVEKKGRNKFSNFDYFRLDEIIPPAKRICKELGLFTLVTFWRDEGGVGGTMEVFDIESKQKVELVSGSGTAKLTACHDIQNTGAVQTYVRRYLWITLLDLVEPEDLDNLSGKPEKEKLPEKTITVPPKTQSRPEKKPEPAAKKEEPKKEEPKSGGADNYNIHFMKQIQKTGNMKGALDMIKKIYGKNATDMTVTEKKKVLATMMQDLPKAGITID